MRDLKDQGINIQVINNSWGGSGYSRALREAGLKVTDLSDYTGFPEMLDGRQMLTEIQGFLSSTVVT